VVLIPIAAGLVGCGSDLQLPPPAPGGATHLALVDGDGQRGIVGQPLPSMVVVSVTDQAGIPVRDAQVAFVLTNGAGRLTPDTATTAADGRVRAQWTLGTAAGPQAAEARLLTGGKVAATAVLTANAVPGAADRMLEISGNHQAGAPLAQLPDSLVVQVVDRYANPVAGVNVAWKVARGGGRVSGSTVATGSDGHSAVTWTLGFTFGRQQVTANVDGVQGSPIRFDTN
jgi:hypothetical protein